jgi:UDPglucose 6-dehydrogenase
LKTVIEKKVSIVGTGYVGLCTAVGFASKGYKVVASTHDPEKAELINDGIPPFFEYGLQELLQRVVKKGYLKCVLDRKEAVLNTDITIISVSTPSQLDGSINLRFIKSSAREIGEALRKKDAYHLVVVKSTVVPGTTENLVKPTVEKSSGKRCGVDFGLCMNPEFLREGSALHDTLHPDRVIIGEHDKKSGDTLESLYRDFFGENIPPTIRTNLPTAELIKYANNAFLATKISFVNTVANICQEIPRADVTAVAEGIGLDERINPLFLNAGLGYGGSCLPKDVKALIAFSESLGYIPVLFKAVEDVNNMQPYRAIKLAKKIIGDLAGKRVAVLGLAFKPDTDDMREAVSIKVINELLEEGANVVAYDPKAVVNARQIFGDKIEYAHSSMECLKDTECCIVVTEWKEFKQLEPKDFVRQMKSPLVIDGRRIYNQKEFSRRLNFASIGLSA